MMITEDLVRITNWYYRSLRAANEVAVTPGARDLYFREARKAAAEYLETYGKEIPHA